MSASQDAPDPVRLVIDLRRLGSLPGSKADDELGSLNHRLIEHQGGLFGVVPSAQSSWDAPSLAPLRKEARAWLERASPPELDDPRLAVTLPFWRGATERPITCSIVGADPGRLSESPLEYVLGSAEAASAVWGIYAASALLEAPHAARRFEPPVEPKHQDELLQALSTPPGEFDPRLDPDYLRAAIRQRHAALQDDLRERLRSQARFLGYQALAERIEGEDLARAQGRHKNLSKQLQTTRAALSELEANLQSRLGEWFRLEDCEREIDRLVEANRLLRDSWSYRLGRKLLRVPRAVYLRVKEADPPSE